MKYIKIQNKTYTFLGINDGNVSCGLKFDLNNEVAKTGNIWNMQPWHYRSKMYNIFTDIIRNLLKLYTWHNNYANKIQNRAKLTNKFYSLI